MSEVTQWRIGPWIFDAADSRLKGAEREMSLEHRAARTLAMLCRSRGRAVTRDEILAEVWDGRTVSANSVAIVIADLRRALGDDASEPTYIITVPKRGYRLAEDTAVIDGANEPPAIIRRRPGRVGAAVLLSVLLMVSGIFFLELSRRHEPGRVAIVVGRITNDTGHAQYQPIAVALQELVTDRIARSGRDVILSDAGAKPRGGERVLWLRSRLILWNSTTTLSMEAVDKTGRVIWNAMAVAPPDGLASATIAKLKVFDHLAGSMPDP